jgi:hypothetical protein
MAGRAILYLTASLSWIHEYGESEHEPSAGDTNVTCGEFKLSRHLSSSRLTGCPSSGVIKPAWLE